MPVSQEVAQKALAVYHWWMKATELSYTATAVEFGITSSEAQSAILLGRCITMNEKRGA